MGRLQEPARRGRHAVPVGNSRLAVVNEGGDSASAPPLPAAHTPLRRSEAAAGRVPVSQPRRGHGQAPSSRWTCCRPPPSPGCVLATLRAGRRPADSPARQPRGSESRARSLPVGARTPSAPGGLSPRGQLSAAHACRGPDPRHRHRRETAPGGFQGPASGRRAWERKAVLGVLVQASEPGGAARGQEVPGMQGAGLCAGGRGGLGTGTLAPPLVPVAPRGRRPCLPLRPGRDRPSELSCGSCLATRQRGPRAPCPL